nr:MAG TPA: hypothetical protein [Caudoviricetes sp.]
MFSVDDASPISAPALGAVLSESTFVVVSSPAERVVLSEGFCAGGSAEGAVCPALTALCSRGVS